MKMTRKYDMAWHGMVIGYGLISDVATQLYVAISRDIAQFIQLNTFLLDYSTY